MALLVAVTLLQAPLKADELTACKLQVRDCESLLMDADRTIQLQGMLMKMQDEQTQTLQQQVGDLQSELSHEQSWYKQPGVVGPVAFILGVALGAYVVNKVGH